MNIDIESIIKTALSMGVTVFIEPDSVKLLPDDKEEPKVAPKEEPKPEPVKKRAPALKKALDMGKVRALRKAGWTFDKIADEMGVSPQTIANRLKGEE